MDPTPARTPAAGLPPVEPPSAKLMLRLFLVPFLIVAVLVGMYLIGQALYGKLWRSRSPDKVLKDLADTNPDIRWRAASDLSQELPRSPELAGDVRFALAIADRLQAALDETAGPEKEFADRAEAMPANERTAWVNKELAPRRNLTTLYAACLGNFTAPAGAPLLSRMAAQTAGMEPSALAEQRRRALFALAAMGESLNRYDAAPEETKDRAEASLAESGSRWAAPALAMLQARRRGKPDSGGVLAALEKCSADDDPSLRMFAAYAATFWRGTTAEEASTERFLAALSRDPGTGEDTRAERLRGNPDTKGASRPTTSRPGYEVQVNANVALIRRGSPLVRLDLLEEMLDPARLRENFLLVSPGGEKQPDESAVVLTLVGTLRALPDLARLRPEMRGRVTALLPKVEALAADGNEAVRKEARAALEALKA